MALFYSRLGKTHSQIPRVQKRLRETGPEFIIPAAIQPVARLDARAPAGSGAGGPHAPDPMAPDP